MRALRQNEVFAIILFLIGGFVGSYGIWFGYLISAGALYWYFKHGQNAKGWIGPNLEEMKKENADIELKLFDYTQASRLPVDEKHRLEDRRRKLQEDIEQWTLEHQRSGL